jgi:hypothetical protein
MKTNDAAASRAGHFTAVFPSAATARDFFERVSADPAASWNASDVRRNGKTVTWENDREPADEGSQPGWLSYWLSMCETVGYYGSSFGEPPSGRGRKTAYLNGRACPASM